ncbi:fin bud initiation factor-like [Carassius carassius]|uniref:fin bud initiation factor-like n=1 Tax=Carassius carassius TaxID=217509 RepID=UPI0028695DA8|nr:fin bud initiation factor-like [Carassius carassius]
MWTSSLSGQSDLPSGQKLSIMLPFALGLFVLPLCAAVYYGPLLPEMSNGTFHHFFVPDGDYEENVDPEKCQMLFKWIDRRPCPLEEDQDSIIREDFIIMKQQIEDAARVLESLGKSISYDLDGEDSYGKYLKREIVQINEAFTNVEKSLVELETKFKQNQDTEQREENEFTSNFIKPMYNVRDTLQETLDISSGLKDKHELISLIIRSHGSRLSRLKNDYLNVKSHRPSGQTTV